MATRVRHWKHGWIPISPEAKAFVAHRGPNPTAPKGRAKVRRTSTGASIPRSVVGRVNKANLQHEIEANGGFTYDPRTGGVLRVGEAKGFAVAVPGTEHIVGEGSVDRETFAKGVAKVIMANRQKIAKGAVLGGWYSPDRGQYMVELTEIHPPDDREGAIRAGIDRNQEAIFDLATGETIPTGGTGDAGLREKATT